MADERGSLRLPTFGRNFHSPKNANESGGPRGIDYLVYEVRIEGSLNRAKFELEKFSCGDNSVLADNGNCDRESLPHRF